MPTKNWNNLNRLAAKDNTSRYPCRYHSRSVFRNPPISRKRPYIVRTSRVSAYPRISIGGPFGEVVKKTGLASGQPFQFSIKYRDAETGLIYYGYRYYQPSTGRWCARDPFGEKGGQNLYTFVLNSPTWHVDLLGLRCKCCVKPGSLKVTLDSPPFTQNPTINPRFHFTIRFEYEEDGTVQGPDICSFNACQFKQLVKGSFLYNGANITQRSTGWPWLPINSTTRVNDGYSIDDNDKPPVKGVFTTHDQPQINFLNAYVDVSYYWNFEAQVIDIKPGTVVASKADYWVMITGRYPRTPYSGGFD